MLRLPLHDAGFDTVEMENGMQALKWLVNNQTDLMVLDVSMPEMDGIQLAYEIKRRRAKPPILAISAGEHVMSKESCLRFMESLGAAETLPKPFELEDFMKRVKRMVKRPVG